MSDQEFSQDEEQQGETPMKDLEVEEEQQDDVTGGRMTGGRPDDRDM
jgi:hypothetical protein